MFREAGMQVSPVTMSCSSLRTAAPPCLLLDIKDLLKLFALGLLLLAFGLLAFWCGRLMERKRIAEGKRSLKGEIELLKENC
jgi:hypothetical protein